MLKIPSFSLKRKVLFCMANKLIYTIWALSITAGFLSLIHYALASGKVGYGTIWPNTTSIELDKKAPTLIMFFHPQCSCSKASVSGLIDIVRNAKNKINVIVVLYKPEEKLDTWITQSDIWKRLVENKIKVIIDTNGVESKKFNSATSGQTYLYETNGFAVFSGGVTPARGHEGDSRGKMAILNYVNNHTVITKITAVFGCSLTNPERKSYE